MCPCHRLGVTSVESLNYSSYERSYKEIFLLGIFVKWFAERITILLFVIPRKAVVS